MRRKWGANLAAASAPGARALGPHVVIKMQRFSVPRANPIQNPSHVVRDERHIAWPSPDGRRMVQVFGPRSEAFLYDKSGAEPIFMKYLAQDADKARFSGGQAGRPLRILLDFKDGSFALYNENGDPLDAPSPSLPPPPANAPGQ